MKNPTMHPLIIAEIRRILETLELTRSKQLCFSCGLPSFVCKNLKINNQKEKISLEGEYIKYLLIINRF